jgi:hypothetical protein
MDPCLICGATPGPLCSWECRRQALDRIGKAAAQVRALATVQTVEASDIRRAAATLAGTLQSAIWRSDLRDKEQP